MTAPVFIEIKKYREVLHRADLLKFHIAEVQRLIQEIDSLRQQEIRHVESTRNQLDVLQLAVNRVEEEL